MSKDREDDDPSYPAFEAPILKPGEKKWSEGGPGNPNKPGIVTRKLSAAQKKLDKGWRVETKPGGLKRLSEYGKGHSMEQHGQGKPYGS